MEICVSALTVNTSAVLGNIDAYAKDLALAKAAPGHALCLCTAPPRKLVIRAVGKRLFLAVWPHDGHKHHYACPFYRDEEVSSIDPSASLPAIKETSQGFEIATDFQLFRILADLGVAAPESTSSSLTATPTGSRLARARMGLLGVVHHLWKESSLNTWGANWKRDWWRVTQALLPVIEHGKLDNRPMTDCIYLVPERNPKRIPAIERAWDNFRLTLIARDGAARLGVILGEATLMEKSQFGYKLSLLHFPPFLYFSEALRAKLATSYPKAYHRIGSRDRCSVIAICLVELTAKGNLLVTDAALMPTSLSYIPIDSGYEAALADLLVSQNRSFIKPISVRAGESLLPDFILTDTKPEYVLEVFGMNTLEYTERKISKMAQYRAEGKPVWSWEPILSHTPPKLPLRSSQGEHFVKHYSNHTELAALAKAAHKKDDSKW
jgi:hypothetical protein